MYRIHNELERTQRARMPRTYHKPGPTQRVQISKFLVTCHLYPGLFLRFKWDFPNLHKTYFVVLSCNVVYNGLNIIYAFITTNKHVTHNNKKTFIT
ncbi:hypothetical protein F383_03628 [Gossypium arboreum]|uniref:Uncharacterized protein n=1 Tax=Gossypium arboreum TaxID=29729 RepID=A0A0B0PHQ0_GOSAR|nr:hypothetical protein F383_03628 [Gossypium arboreum]